jgi:hypothetical protein
MILAGTHRGHSGVWLGGSRFHDSRKMWYWRTEVIEKAKRQVGVTDEAGRVSETKQTRMDHSRAKSEQNWKEELNESRCIRKRI